MKIPLEIIQRLEEETEGIDYGEAALTIYLRAGKPRYTITRERSILSENLNSHGSKKNE